MYNTGYPTGQTINRMRTNNNPEFQYGGHTFKGVREFTENEDFHTISKNLCQEVKMLDGCAWEHDSFYQKAESVTDENFDVFLMDSKYEVIPCQYALHIWGYDMDNKYMNELLLQENRKIIVHEADELEQKAIAYLKQWIELKGIITFNEEDGVLCFYDIKGQPISEKIVSVEYEDGCLFVYTTDDCYRQGDMEVNLTTCLNIIRALK